MSALPAKGEAGLPELAGEIRREHEAVEAGLQATVAAAIRCGELLVEAKAQVKHGDWYGWLDRNFPSTPQTASGYMRLAANREQIESASSIRGALKQLAPPSAAAAEPSDGSIPETADALREMIASEAIRLLPLDQFEDLERLLDSEMPRRKDFRPGGEGDYHADLAEARYLLAEQNHHRDKRLLLYNLILGSAQDLIDDDPIEGPLVLAYAATAIRFITAERHWETPREDESDSDERYAAAQEAWMAHRAARDAHYRASGETPIDERPLDFNDALYHPELQGLNGEGAA